MAFTGIATAVGIAGGTREPRPSASNLVPCASLLVGAHLPLLAAVGVAAPYKQQQDLFRQQIVQNQHFFVAVRADAF